MSYPYSNYNNSNAWDKGRQPQALQDLLKLQQQLQGQTSNTPGSQPYNPSQPGTTQNSYNSSGSSNGPMADQNALDFLKQKLAQSQQSYYQPNSSGSSSSPSTGANNYQGSRPPTQQGSGNHPPYNNSSQGMPSRPGSQPPYNSGSSYPPYDPRSTSGSSNRYGGPGPQHQGHYPPSYSSGPYSDPRAPPPNGPPGGAPYRSEPPRNAPPGGAPYRSEPPRNAPPGGGYPPHSGPGHTIGHYDRPAYPGPGSNPPEGNRPPYSSNNSNTGSRQVNPKNVPPTIGTMTSPFSKPGPSTSSQSGNSRRNERRRDRGGSRRDKESRREPDRDRQRRDSRSREPSREKSPRKRKEVPSEPRRSSRPRDDRKPVPSSPFQYSLASSCIDYLQLRQRYKRMKIPKDFASVKRVWKSSASLSDIPKDFEIPFACSSEIDNHSTIEQLTASTYETASVASDGSYYSSKILLYAGQREPKKISHPSNSYRFIVGRKDRCELFCIGGYWSKDLDGGDPASDRSVLRKTAARCCKQFCGLDLTSCEWIHFLEIQYQRPTGREISVVLLPCIWKIPLETLRPKAQSMDLSAGSDTDEDPLDEPVPDLPEHPESDPKPKEAPADTDEMKEVQDDSTNSTTAAPEGPGTQDGDAGFVIDKKPSKENAETEEKEAPVPLVTKVPEGLKLKALDLSLYGLLEYDESDDTEKTFEVSLAGELFSDMLKREFGATIKCGLEAFRTQRAKLLTSDEPPKKKQKTEEDAEGNETKDTDTPPDSSLSLGEELIPAFEFFDRNRRGYFRPEQLEDILYSLGDNISVREVEELVDPLIDPESGRILYKQLISDGVLAQGK